MEKRWNALTPEQREIIEKRGTEPAFSGAYWDHWEDGTYVCARCNTPLFSSKSKFKSGTGWPSFDDAIEGNVILQPDPDGVRTEVICANCKGHLGHVFFGEGFTPKNTRYCINSLALKFIPEEHKKE